MIGCSPGTGGGAGGCGLFAAAASSTKTAPLKKAASSAADSATFTRSYSSVTLMYPGAFRAKIDSRRAV